MSAAACIRTGRAVTAGPFLSGILDDDGLGIVVLRSFLSQCLAGPPRPAVPRLPPASSTRSVSLSRTLTTLPVSAAGSAAVSTLDKVTAPTMAKNAVNVWLTLR